MTDYMCYRELRYQLGIINGSHKPWSVYNSETLTDRQQGRMITLEEYDQD